MSNLTELQVKKLENGREYRNMVIEARAGENEDDSYIVEGYATTFNQPYELYSYGNYKVIEQVDSRAFESCDMDDVIFQYDHEGRVYARTRNNTLEIKPDSKGLFIRADLSGTEAGRNLHNEIKGGYTDKMSFGFVVEEATREYTENNDTGEETCLRTITKIKKLYDVSAVSIPANDMTAISARNLGKGVIEEIEAERLKRANKLKQLKLMIEVTK